jgi:hypothetical protein
MPELPGQDGRDVPMRWSRGTRPVPYFERWQDNVLPPPMGQDWPPMLIRQVRAYTARRTWFSQEDAEALAAQLQRISKFQSINSEDAVTWSWFGTLSCAEPVDVRGPLQWLYDRLGLDVQASNEAVISQWERVVHPNALGSRHGPELDARIDDRDVLIYVEAKWNADLGTGRGAAAGVRDDQIVLRRDSFRIDPTLIDDGREFVVLGVSNNVPDLTAYNEPPLGPKRRTVKIDWLTWSDMATCQAHPRCSEFQRYLSWKKAVSALSRSSSN